jgi:multiple sugar transport system ATP-binding protein
MAEPSHPETSHLSVVDVSKGYGNNPILKGVSLEVARGEFVALVGASGCGKSTLLRIIAGLDAADQGRILIGGQDVSAMRAADRDVAMVFQSYALYPHLTARQNLAVPLAMRRLNAWQRLPFIGGLMPGRRRIGDEMTNKINEVAESLKITALLDRKPAAMSGGQRQRVALGRAIVREPKAFLMDEPLSNLDAALRVHTRAEIVDLHKRLGATTIYVTHDQEEALSMADKVAVMKDGRILQFAPPRVVYGDPDNLEVAEFIGTPKINLIPALVDEMGWITIGGTELLPGFDAWRGQVLTLGLRPDHAELLTTGDVRGRHYRLPYEVDRVEFLGGQAIAHGTVPSGGQIRVRVEPDAVGVAPGRLLTLAIPANQLLVFASDGSRIRLRRPALEAPVFEEHAHA